MTAGASVTLLVGGSIAAYKSAELVREFVKRELQVNVVMSETACKFITPLTLQTLSGNAVTVDLFEVDREAQVNHIKLADGADVVLAAPATANLIAKAAAGLADDAPSTVLMATRAPVIIAPAMNVNMWLHPATQHNVAVLKERGVRFVGPDEGDLACGWHARGRLADLKKIIEEVEAAIASGTERQEV
jgi:phosphopantothenoylcysteine decarboxylase / phosphopantothenate---cysteine ligase